MESAYMKGYGKKFKEFKDLSEEDKKEFIKGVIEKQPITSVNFYSFDITKDNKDFINYLVTKFKATVLSTYVTFVDDNAVDFFGYIYDNFSNLKMEGAEQALANSLFQGTITFIKNDPNAVIPRKAHLSDTGFDLTIIKKVKDMGDFVEMYDTGIIVKPPEGYYCEVVGRSSISKTGYMLANNTGIIDSTYRDSIKVVLFRYDLNKPKIELPCKIAQILVKPKFNFLPIVDELPSLEETMRGEGGFGSTNQNQGV